MRSKKLWSLYFKRIAKLWSVRAGIHYRSMAF